MVNIHRTNRVRMLLARGSVAGGKIALISSILYILFIIVLLSIWNRFAISEGAMNQAMTPPSEQVVGYLFFGFVMCILGGIPSMIVGAISGGVIGLILSLAPKKTKSILACLIGLFVGLLFIPFVYYLSWLSTINAPYPSDVSFLEYMSPPSNPIEAIFLNPYFFPSIIAILISPYVAWKINESEIVQSEPTNE